MKILCPNHKEDTPSFHIYPDGSGFCFGCSYYEPAKSDRASTSLIRELENVTETLAYINGLPKQTIRGLSLPTDNRFYYIVWPNSNYYVRRRKEDNNDGTPKYIGPSGHKKPLFIAKIGTGSQLIVVEGQMNALSLAQTDLDATIVSPGGTGDFKKTCNLPYYSVYANILLLLDNDAPGALGAIELKSHLAVFKKNVAIRLMEKDANELLQEIGPEGLAKWVRNTHSDLGLQGRL